MNFREFCLETGKYTNVWNLSELRNYFFAVLKNNNLKLSLLIILDKLLSCSSVPWPTLKFKFTVINVNHLNAEQCAHPIHVGKSNCTSPVSNFQPCSQGPLEGGRERTLGARLSNFSLQFLYLRKHTVQEKKKLITEREQVLMFLKTNSPN